MRQVIGAVRGHLRPLSRGIVDGVRLVLVDGTARRPPREQTQDDDAHQTSDPDDHPDDHPDGRQGQARGRDRGRFFYLDVDALGGRIVVRGPVDAGTAGVIVHCIDHLAQMCATSITIDLTHAELVLVVAVRRIEAASARALRSGSSVALVADGGSLAHRVLTTWTTVGPA